LHLLVTSQNEDMLNLFEAYFSSSGFNYTLTNSGSQCLDKFVRRDKEFDVIIVDTSLSDLDGLYVVKTVLAANPDQKIMITTGNSSLKRQATFIGIDPENILLKPFRFGTLISAIREIGSRTYKIQLKDHVLALYNSVDEGISEAVQFLQKGIKKNECVMFLGNKEGIELVKKKFNSNKIDVNRMVSDSSIIFMDSKQWYIPDGKVDKNRIKTQWLDLVNKCTSNGKTGLRSFCMTDTFFEHKVGDDLVDYENSLSPNFDFQFLPVCAYTQSNFGQLSQKQQEILVTSHNHVWMQTNEKTKSNQKI